MSTTADYILDAMNAAGWPLEGMEVAIGISEQVGLDALQGELRDRAQRACDGWRGCLVQQGEGHGALCEPCPLTTTRDAHSDEMEGR